MLTLRRAKRVVIGVIGGTVLFLGLALVVLPGPAFVVIPAGLAILASEFAWARLWLRKMKRMIQRPRKQSTNQADPTQTPSEEQIPASTTTDSSRPGT